MSLQTSAASVNAGSSPPLRINDRTRQLIASGRIEAVELGCGRTKRLATAIGIDLLDSPEIDMCGDVFEALAQLPAGSVGSIHAAHFFEHIPDLPGLLSACARVLAPDGVLEVTVPHFSNPYYYSDYTHARPFGLYSMSYLCKDDILRRKVPSYGKAFELKLADVRLTFKSAFKYSLRNILLRSYDPLVNCSRYTQELYEEIFSKLVPCYEVTYFLRRIDGTH